MGSTAHVALFARERCALRLLCLHRHMLVGAFAALGFPSLMVLSRIGALFGSLIRSAVAASF